MRPPAIPDAVDYPGTVLRAPSPSVPFFDQGRWAVYQCWAASQLRNGRWIEAHNVWALAAEQHPHSPGSTVPERSCLLVDHVERLQQPGRQRKGSAQDTRLQTVERAFDATGFVT